VVRRKLLVEWNKHFAILTFNKPCLFHFVLVASLVGEEDEVLDEQLGEQPDDMSASFSMDSASANDDASLERRLDDAYESGKETCSEGNDLLSQVLSRGAHNDSIMNDETAHNKRGLDEDDV
jgi:hypothetical protein